LVRRLVARGERVYGYRFEGQWLDIGRPEDYEVAIEAVTEGRFGAIATTPYGSPAK
jgi:NDP-sugar pyrophosphorylase family protein